MTVIFECDSQFVRPGRFKSTVMTRYYFAWFAVSFLHVDLKTFSETEYKWR